jgi:catechol-2,3-dioxygenase
MAAPSRFCHVVYKTHRYNEMIEWYLKVFQARIQHRDDRLCFLTYDDEHHRMAFLNLGPGEAKNASAPRTAPGVLHVAYAWRSLGELIDTYTRLKSYGIPPTRPVRHGLTLSLYYDDPDGNNMEFQVDTLTSEEANAFMAGPAFAKNPIGEDFDLDDLVRRYELGEAVDDLVFRSDQPQHRERKITRHHPELLD